MSLLKETIQVLEQLPEPQLREVRDFADFIRTREPLAGEHNANDQPARSEVEELIAEEVAFAANRPTPPPGTFYKFCREDAYEDGE